ncbi:MAG: hypothetical protein ACRETA_04480 [Gammaproteobacteria bacterium]
MKPMGGSAQVVFVIMMVLFLAASWSNFVVPLLSVVWNKTTDPTKNSVTNINWKVPIGLGLMVIFMTFISSISDDAAGLMILMALGMITVYAIETKGGAFSSLFNWINPASPAPGSYTSNQPSAPGHGATQ